MQQILLQNFEAILLQNASGFLVQNATVIVVFVDFIKKCHSYSRLQRLL